MYSLSITCLKSSFFSRTVAWGGRVFMLLDGLSEQCVILNLITVHYCDVQCFMFKYASVYYFNFILITVIFIFSFRAAISNKFELS